MRKIKVFSLGWASLALAILASGAWGEARLQPAAPGVEKEADRQATDRESELLAKAKDAMFRSDWIPAARSFDEYLASFPSGRFRDEAAYWSAHCRVRTARTLNDPGREARLRLEALDRLDPLVSGPPRSSWLEEARALKVEIEGEMAAAGSKEHVLGLRRIIEDPDPSRKSLRLLALKALSTIQPAFVLSHLKRAAADEPDPSLRIQAVRLLGDIVTAESAACLDDIARQDDDALIRQTAAYWAGRIRFRLIPSRVQFEVRACTLLDRIPDALLPEGRAVVLDLPSIEPWPSRLKETVEKRLGSRLSKPEAETSSRENKDWEIYEAVALTGVRYHEMVVTLSFRKTPDRIEGTAQFTDLRTGISYYEAAPRPDLNTVAAFSLEAGKDAVVLVRRGAKVVIVALRFESAGGPDSSALFR